MNPAKIKRFAFILVNNYNYNQDVAEWLFENLDRLDKQTWNSIQYFRNNMAREKKILLSTQTLVTLSSVDFDSSFTNFASLCVQMASWMKTYAYNLVTESIKEYPKQERLSYTEFEDLYTMG